MAFGDAQAATVATGVTYVSDVSSGAIAFLTNVTPSPNSGTLMVASTAGGSPAMIASGVGYYPIWLAKDGSRVFFSASAAPNTLLSAPAGGGAVATLATDALASNRRESADGTAILTTTSAGSLVVVSLTGGGSRVLSQVTDTPYWFDISADAKTAFYTDLSNALHAVDTTTLTDTLLDSYAYTPSPTTDGLHLLWAGRSPLALVALDTVTHAQVSLASSPSYWSVAKNETSVAITAGCGGIATACTLSVASIDGSQSRVVATNVLYTQFAIADDGSEVLFLSDGGKVLSVCDTAGGAPRRLVRGPVSDFFAGSAHVVATRTGIAPPFSFQNGVYVAAVR
jgi:hypothetical protein